MSTTKSAPNCDTTSGNLPDRFSLSRRVPSEIAAGDVVRVVWRRDLSAPTPPYMIGVQPVGRAVPQDRDNLINGEMGFARCLSASRDADGFVFVAEFEKCESAE